MSSCIRKSYSNEKNLILYILIVKFKSNINWVISHKRNPIFNISKTHL